MIYPQMLLDIHDELIVDLFAGGGGASVGIELATGRQVDVAVNHDPIALALHQANHPQTRHMPSDVFEVDPRDVTNGRPVGLLWASPDCTYYSKARGGKPIRSKLRKRRSLAWVVKRWAAQVRPRVIMLENVEEFAGWGPLIGPPDELRPCPRRRGRTFRRWVRELEAIGYRVEWRELRACDYGAPTIRKRLFVIARRDGRPIVWPEPTHGPGTRRPYRTAAECIDWSIPMLSIFASREEARAWGRALGQAPPVRPLAPATLRRIARGVMRYVVESADPFIVHLTHHDSRTGYPVHEPLRTVTGAQRGEQALVAPYLVPRYGEREGQEPRSRSLEEPAPTIVPSGNGAHLVAAHLSCYHAAKRDGDTRATSLDDPAATIDTSNRYGLVAAFLAKHYGGVVGSPLTEPKGTVTAIDHHALVAASLTKLRGTSEAADTAEPLHTVSAGGTHHGVVAAFLQAYYGTHQDGGLEDPLATVTTRDRFGLVHVIVRGEPYYIADIAMRMLQPSELFRAQGFPAEFRITCQVLDKKRRRLRWLTKTEQVRLVGNSVPPQFAEALVRANCPELRARDEVAA